MPPPISLQPLSAQLHDAALQQVYRGVPAYWRLFGRNSAPTGQAQHDLKAAEEETGRYLLGILFPNQPGRPEIGAELIGMIDFRIHWPEQSVAYVGHMMVAEAYQRRGIATQAWRLLAPWLRDDAQVDQVRLGVEQFNLPALRFFRHVGFCLTGEAARVPVGSTLVRLLYMEQTVQVGVPGGNRL